jgi:hypothetical protein
VPVEDIRDGRGKISIFGANRISTALSPPSLSELLLTLPLWARVWRLGIPERGFMSLVRRQDFLIN